jgi:CRP/FNR family transcriptional regulator, cyclic AMP receptor protein
LVSRFEEVATGLRTESGRQTATEVCHVLREDPDLAEGLAGVAQDCVVGAIRLPRGRWAGELNDLVGAGIGLLVLEGLLLRRVGVDGRYGAELLGEGDLLRPWQGEDSAPALQTTTGWHVLRPTRLAVLDESAARKFAVHPVLTGRLVGRALQRSRNLAVNMAIVHQARVDTRLQMLFWHLAERWGRVRADGVVLPLDLTHAVLADLVAARRPTVTTALTDLSRRGLVIPVAEGWLVSGDPPGELLELGGVSMRYVDRERLGVASGPVAERRQRRLGRRRID